MKSALVRMVRARFTQELQYFWTANMSAEVPSMNHYLTTQLNSVAVHSYSIFDNFNIVKTDANNESDFTPPAWKALLKVFYVTAQHSGVQDKRTTSVSKH